MSADWESEPATERQRRKLRFYGQVIAVGTTKAQASDLIDDEVSKHPEREAEYHAWVDGEDDLLLWHQTATILTFAKRAT